MTFKELVKVVKAAIPGGLTQDAKVLVDIGSGPLLDVERITGHLDDVQQLVFTAPPQRAKPRRKHMKATLTMFEIWDRQLEKVEA